LEEPQGFLWGGARFEFWLVATIFTGIFNRPYWLPVCPDKLPESSCKENPESESYHILPSSHTTVATSVTTPSVINQLDTDKKERKTQGKKEKGTEGLMFIEPVKRKAGERSTLRPAT
jgi:hypothetical protein